MIKSYSVFYLNKYISLRIIFPSSILPKNQQNKGSKINTYALLNDKLYTIVSVLAKRYMTQKYMHNCSNTEKI